MAYILKSTIRNFIHKPVTNLINLLGLAVSLALVIVLSVYCYSELTTDHFHKNGDRVYVYGQNNESIASPGILKDHIDQGVPGVEASVRMAATWEAPVFRAADKEPITSDLIFADLDFFKLFTYPVVEGNLETALKEPMSVVITESLAHKLFGRGQAVGKIINMNGSKELIVSAVIGEPKGNTFLSFSAVASVSTRKFVQAAQDELTTWKWYNFRTFLLLKKGTSSEETAKRIASVVPENERKMFLEGKLIPLRKIYFSKFSAGWGDFFRFGEKKKVMILLLVASLVLLIALVNFINISSSQWMEKTRQNGLIKVLGAKRSSILRNVIVEAGFFFFMALCLSVLLINLFNMLIHGYTGLHFRVRMTHTPGFILISVAGTFMLSIISSLVPAIRISFSKAVDNLKNKTAAGRSVSLLRGIFVTAQFVIAIVLIAFTVLVQKQVRFGSNLGFNHDNIIGIKLTSQLGQKKEVLKKILLESPSVKDVSFSMYFPGGRISNWGTTFSQKGEEKQVTIDMFNADASVFETFGLKLLMGRFYSDDLSTDKDKVVVNETFLREYGITNPIGGKLILSMDGQTSEIVGVIKDFHIKSFSQPIAPLVITNQQFVSYCLVKLQTANFNLLHSAIEYIKLASAQLSPEFPVEISFFDQAVEKMYQSELQFRRTFTLFSGCALSICCLGILAMSMFASQRRVKEIGVRKVNGATVSEVMAMLNKDFVKWVVVAFVIATPIAYYAMNKWLNNFAYKTTLSWWIFALAGLLVLGIALLTVSWQSWRAATRNPVEALRYE